jgi:hypothetical protein
VIAEAGDDDVSAVDVRMAKLVGERGFPWLPAVDLRGEGIFIRLKEGGKHGLQQWEKRKVVQEEATRLAEIWKQWRLDKEMPELPFRERLYVSNGEQPMAGILLYTASNDSDGSLGGLVDQARSSRLEEVLSGALREAGLCAQDPLCGGREMEASVSLNGSACHACLLIAENSCERGNRLIDRNLLVSTVGIAGLEYFGNL